MKKFYAIALAALATISASALTPQRTKHGQAAKAPGIERVAAHHGHVIGRSQAPRMIASRAEGDGTMESPFTVEQVIAINPQSTSATDYAGVWVSGYIVGSIPSTGSVVVASTEFGVENASTTNLVLAPSADCTDTELVIPVQLPKGDVRNDLNLADNPELLGAEVMICGDVMKYCGAPGLKNASAYEVLKEGDTPDPQDPTDFGEPIFEVEGEHIASALDATGFNLSMFGIDYVFGSYPTEVVWGENDEVYIRDIISMVQGGVYIKGHYADGKVTVQLPQVCYAEIYEEEDWNGYYYATVAEIYDLEEDGEVYKSYMNCDYDKCVIEYEVGEDRSLTLLLNDGDPYDLETLPRYIINFCEDPTPGIDEWWGYGDSYQCFHEFNEVPVELPEGITLTEWVMVANNTTGTAQVGFDGDDVYLANFWEYGPDLVAKGRVEGDKVVFDSQYMGEAYGYFVYLEGVEWADEEFVDFTMLDALVMDYDAENKVMAVNNDLIDLLFNTVKGIYMPADYYENPTFQYQSDEQLNAAPEDPWVAYFDDIEYRDYLGIDEGYIDWVIPNMNVDGYLLPTEKMFYHFLVDGEVMTFTTEEYPTLDQDYTDVPYDFTDEWDIQVSGESHTFSFRFAGTKSFGMQSFYRGSDGVTYASNVVTYETSAAPVIGSESMTVVKTEFFDLQGRRVNNPGEGVYVVRYTYANGTSSVTKLVR